MSTATTSTVKQPPKLPSPQDCPEADVVIYDGHCNLCTGGVRRLMRLDWGRRLAFISLHDPVVTERYPDLTHDLLMEQMYVIDRAERRHGGARALRYLTRRLPTLWLAAPLLHIPGTLGFWQWAYKKVAQQRYRWNKESDCDNGACAIHFGAKPAKKD